MAQTLTPINPAVLKWALDESGFDAEELARRVRRPLDEIEAWLNGTGMPTQAQLRAIGEQLRRPTAIFYLASPPADGNVPTNLRSAPGLADHALGHEEVRRIRWLLRFQRTLSWLGEESGDPPVAIPSVAPDTSADTAGELARAWLDVSATSQRAWRNGREAFQGWREAVEDKGLLVAQFQIDRQAIRGFSAWDDFVPLVAVNTAYTPQARSYTLLHELGHLFRRNGSACYGFAGPSDNRRVERWCEEFAASVLLPGDDTYRVAGAMRQSGLESEDLARAVAREFGVSVRASAIRLIDLGLASRALYDVVDASAGRRHDDFPDQRDGGGGQTSAEARIRQFGAKAVSRLLAAERSGALTRRDVGDYLHLSSTQVSDLADLARR